MVLIFATEVEIEMGERAGMAIRDELLTPRQVHADYGFSPRTLANWRWCGTGPTYIKQSPGRGGRIKYKRSAIEQWLAERTVQAGGAAA
jgi:predicted DNA-binding transcriptional regulator AlpA